MSEPGWYPDPHNASRFRLWDGQQWTEQTSDVPASQTPAPPHARWRAAIVAGAIIAAIATVTATLAFTSSSETPTESITAVVLESSTTPGQDPFTSSVATTDTPDKIPTFSSPDGNTEPVPATTPGLYGGTGDLQTCDLDALTDFLTEQTNKANAFSQVITIPSSDLNQWINTLTPVILRQDTLVTNHGYTNGQANPYQAVLQAGTAVAIDQFGVPRVRCECGNPLAPPAVDTPQFTGAQWPGFEPDQTITIKPSDTSIETLTITNITSGETYEQPVTSTEPQTYEVSTTSIAGIPFGSTEAEALPLLTAILGEPTETSRESCLEPGYERVKYFWGSFGVRFEFGQLDAWLAFEPNPSDPTIRDSDGGLPEQLRFVPASPDMTLGEVDAAINRNKAADPQSWLNRAETDGFGFHPRKMIYERLVVESWDRGSPLLRVGFGSDTPDTPALGVVAHGEFTAVGNPQYSVCFGSDNF